ncbi:hypothetical protein [Enterobacter hormaechei]|uniref:tail fiber/spike domain-containing protein n=1 Tax=Enterobacter hormaechei TaxID=158836 RepID=UPI0033158F0A
MATQPTNLPVPSESPRDLKFNAGKIDEFVTSLVNTYVDRFGNEHYTIEGLRWLAQQAIAQYGWILVDSFQDGADITLPNQALRDEETGEYFRWDGALPKHIEPGSTPSSSGGIGIGAWISVGDASLRTDIENGYLNPKYSRVYQTVADMKSGNLKVGDNVTWNGYYAAGDGGGNSGVVVSGPLTADDGSIFSLSNGLYVAAIFDGSIDPLQFGLAESRSAAQNKISLDNTFKFALDNKKPIVQSRSGLYDTDPVEISGASYDYFYWECSRGEVTYRCTNATTPLLTLHGDAPPSGSIVANTFQYCTIKGFRFISPYCMIRYFYTEKMRLQDLIFSGTGTTCDAIIGPMYNTEYSVWDILEKIVVANCNRGFVSGVAFQSESPKHVYVGDCTFRDWDFQNCGLQPNAFVFDGGYFDGGLLDNIQFHMNAAAGFITNVHCLRLFKPSVVNFKNCYFWEANGTAVQLLSPRYVRMDGSNMIWGAGQTGSEPGLLITNFDGLTSHGCEISPLIANGYGSAVQIVTQGGIDLSGLVERDNCKAGNTVPGISLNGCDGIKMHNLTMQSPGGAALNLLSSNVEVFNINYSGYTSQSIRTSSTVKCIPANSVRQLSTVTNFLGVFDDEIQCNASTGATTVTLLPASDCPAKLVRIVKTDGTANGVQIVPASGSGNTINGAGSYSLTAQYAFVYLRSTGNNWIIVGKS